jgi:hypothetical protein
MMKILTTVSLFLSFFIFSWSPLSAQIDVPPRFPGGNNAYYKFMNEQLKYPQSAMISESDRIIKVILTIDTLGKAKVQEFIFENSGLGFEEEVESFVLKMPNWQPAVFNGVISKSQVILAFDFKYTHDLPENAQIERYELRYYENSDIPPFFEYGLDSLQVAMKYLLIDSLKLKSIGGLCSFDFLIDTLGRTLNVSVLENKSDISDKYWLFAFQSVPGWIPGLRDGIKVNVRSSTTLTIHSE